MASVTKFLNTYLRSKSRHGVVATETTYRRGDREIPATFYRPAGGGTLPGWVVLHGLTCTGRQHPGLIRFVTSIASAGHAVLVPDVPEWRDLRVASTITRETIRCAIRTLHESEGVIGDRVGLFAFSFGATQALIAATDPEVRALIHGIAAWGGYSDLHRLFLFGMTGEHELDGRSYRLQPDPYGGWIMAGNYLPFVPGHETHVGVAAALHELALEAGRVGAYAWEPVYDDAKRRLRATLPPHEREIFDLLAPLTDAPPGDLAYCRELSNALADTVLRVEPGLDPHPYLGRIDTDVLIAHGRDDRVIPFTESIRLSRQIPPERLDSCRITGLFAHSGGTNLGIGPIGLIRETVRFLGLLRATLGLI